MSLPGRGPEAAAHFEEALRIQPDSAAAHNGLGGHLLQAGHDPEAAAQFEAALRSEPALAAAHFNLGIIYSRNPDCVADAITQYEAALRSQPDFAPAHKNLGILLLMTLPQARGDRAFPGGVTHRADPEIAQILNSLLAGPR